MTFSSLYTWATRRLLASPISVLLFYAMKISLFETNSMAGTFISSWSWIASLFVALLLMWQVLFRLFAFIFMQTRLHQNKRIALYGPSYVVSIIHAVTVAIRGLLHFLVLFPAPLDAQGFISFAPTSSKYHSVYQQINLTNLVLVSYLVYDLVHILAVYPALGGVDIILHHFCFLMCSFVATYYQILPFAFSSLALGEFSTPFVSIRWLLKESGHKQSHVMDVVQVAFAVTFFVCRILIYGYLVWNLQISLPVLTTTHPDSVPVPKAAVYIVVCMVDLGYVLNLYWFSIIFNMAWKVVVTGRTEGTGRRTPSLPAKPHTG